MLTNIQILSHSYITGHDELFPLAEAMWKILSITFKALNFQKKIPGLSRMYENPGQ